MHGTAAHHAEHIRNAMRRKKIGHIIGQTLFHWGPSLLKSIWGGRCLSGTLNFFALFCFGFFGFFLFFYMQGLNAAACAQVGYRQA